LPKVDCYHRHQSNKRGGEANSEPVPLSSQPRALTPFVLPKAGLVGFVPPTALFQLPCVLLINRVTRERVLLAHPANFLGVRVSNDLQFCSVLFSCPP
jgi:hypothetical protein